MNADWLAALAEHEREATPCVLVTVVAARGSTPREAGAKMVVSADAQHGSVGGGNLEYACAEAARAMLKEGASAPALRDFPLGPALGQCCGGYVQALLEPIRPPGWTVGLFGAGHVGQAVVHVLGTLPCRIRWIDSRADAFPADMPGNVERRVAAVPEQEARRLPPGAQVVVMTHDHALDFGIVSACLARGDLSFVGLIGSATKAARFRARLTRSGLSSAAIGRLVCPIGVPGMSGKLPAEIAIATAAQLLLLRPAAAPPVSAEIHRLHPRPDCADSCDGCAAAVAR